MKWLFKMYILLLDESYITGCTIYNVMHNSIEQGFFSCIEEFIEYAPRLDIRHISDNPLDIKIVMGEPEFIIMNEGTN
jgi:hypothetical protein